MTTFSEGLKKVGLIKWGSGIVNIEDIVRKGESMLKSGVDVTEATHVKHGGVVEKIASKWGIDANGRLAKPSEGGFGVITESGKRVSMWQAQSYFKEQ